ncbi:cytochrome P450 [Actinocrinis puniceicyclus]|uniref:Cytochrome P450 n=1 Tax=Actinocrinis puniceicyclus TaxID=977794 RepID=A0A8J7WHI1_9ACTN|nr:cytochrome P450 [Actinocrinis puniceicyclus]MBS2962341.1 cytochrome P450 [Actinocrinis puniceicyclus]
MEAEPVSYNPLSPGFFADPYPHYRQLREQNPVHYSRYGFWVLTRYRDVVAAYREPLLSRDMRLWENFEVWRRSPADGPLERMMANWIVMIDPPRHSPLRAIHEQVFDSALMTRADAVAARIVAELAEPARAAGGFDAVADFADRIPVYLLCALLDVPRPDWDAFVGWSRAIALTSEPQLTTKVLQQGREAQQSFYDYLGPLAARRRARPGDDVLSAMAVTEAGGTRLSDEELVDSLVFLYQAGHPTSTQLIALALQSLLEHPGQLGLLRDERSLLPGAIEELQRFDGPVQMNDRVALADIEIDGQPVTKGQVVRLCLASANRDEEQFPDADRLDLRREVRGQLGYGHGLHACIGAALGRAQTRHALGALLDFGPGLRATAQRRRYLPSPSNRGLVSLPVEF